MKDLVIFFIAIAALVYTTQTDKFQKLWESDVSTRTVECIINRKSMQIYNVRKTEFNEYETLIWIDGHDTIAVKLSAATQCRERVYWRNTND